MRLKQYINELYGGPKNNRYEILVNPSKKEIMSIDKGSGIRFIADSKDKKVYVWEVYRNTHIEAWNKYIKPGDEEDNLAKKGIILEGIAEKKGGRYKMVESDQIDAYFGYETDSLKELQKRFKWVDKYISVTNTLQDWMEMEN